MLLLFSGSERFGLVADQILQSFVVKIDRFPVEIVVGRRVLLYLVMEIHFWRADHFVQSFDIEPSRHFDLFEGNGNSNRYYS